MPSKLGINLSVLYKYNTNKRTEYSQESFLVFFFFFFLSLIKENHSRGFVYVNRVSQESNDNIDTLIKNNRTHESKEKSKGFK